MSWLRRSLALAAALALAACSTTNHVHDRGDTHVMLQGHDPVSYFSGTPLPGRQELRVSHHGMTYRFATEENRKAFSADPVRYAPQYGGWCANGMVYAVPLGGGEHWKVIDGKLYLFGGRRSMLYFEMDLARNIKLADGYWENEVRHADSTLQAWKRIWWDRVPHYRSNRQLEADYERRYGRKP